MNPNDELVFKLTVVEAQYITNQMQQLYQMPMQIALKMNQQAQEQMKTASDVQPPQPPRGNSQHDMRDEA